jgi:hypothetical protein
MPTTDAGKSVSRRNSLKHGLTPNSSLLPPNMEAELPIRIAPWVAKFGHLTDPEAPRLIRDIAISELRVEQCQATLAAASNFHRNPILAANAADLAAITLYERLAKHPARVIRQLRQTAAGVARLQRAWTTLDRKLRLELPWTESDQSQVLNLLGLESDDRLLDPDAIELAGATTTLLTSTNPKARQQATDTLLTLIALQQESLQALATHLAAEAAAIQALADSGHDLNPPPQILTIRRYETANRRIYEKSVAKLESLAAAQAEAEAEMESDSVISPPLPPGEVAGQRPAGEGLPQSPPSSFGNPTNSGLVHPRSTICECGSAALGCL